MIHTILIWCMAAINAVILFRTMYHLDRDTNGRGHIYLLKGVALMCAVALGWAGISLALVMAGIG